MAPAGVSSAGSATVDQANVRIPNQHGVIITRASLVQTSEILLDGGIVRSGTQRMITNPCEGRHPQQSFQLCALTLASSGLRIAVVATSSVSTADKVSKLDVAGTEVTKYYLSPYRLENSRWQCRCSRQRCAFQ